MLVAVGKAGAIQYSANGTSWTAASSRRRVRPVVRHVCEWSVRRDWLRRHEFLCRPRPTAYAMTTRTSVGRHHRAVGASRIATRSTWSLGAGGVVLTSPDVLRGPSRRRAACRLPRRGIATIGTTYVTAGDPFEAGNTVTPSSSGIARCIAVDRARERHTRPEPTLRLRHARRRVPLHARQLVLPPPRSTDGIPWSLVFWLVLVSHPARARIHDSLDAIAQQRHHLCRRRSVGAIFTSTDGTTWTSAARGTVLRRHRRCCTARAGSPMFAAGNVGNSLYILTSPDGITWTHGFPTSGTVTTYAIRTCLWRVDEGLRGGRLVVQRHRLHRLRGDLARWCHLDRSAERRHRDLTSAAHLVRIRRRPVPRQRLHDPPGQRQHQRRRHASSTSPDARIVDAASRGLERAARPGRLRRNGMWIAFAPEKPAVFTSTNGNPVDIDGVDVHARPNTSRSATASSSNSALWRSTDGTTWVQQSALPSHFGDERWRVFHGRDVRTRRALASRSTRTRCSSPAPVTD